MDSETHRILCVSWDWPIVLFIRCRSITDLMRSFLARSLSLQLQNFSRPTTQNSEGSIVIEVFSARRITNTVPLESCRKSANSDSPYHIAFCSFLSGDFPSSIIVGGVSSKVTRRWGDRGGPVINGIGTIVKLKLSTRYMEKHYYECTIKFLRADHHYIR
jgi:hypothetical protein